MTLLLWLALSFAHGATAAEAMANPISTRAGTPLQYASDLVGGDRSDRLFAARELRRQARLAARGADRRVSDAQLEARVALADLRDDTLAAAREAVVASPDVRAPLADLIAALGDPSAIPSLESALAAEQRARVRRRIEAALLALRSTP